MPKSSEELAYEPQPATSKSRKYQETVSTKLAEQVLAALYDLLNGVQAANDATEGKLLRDVLAQDSNHVYSGLVTVLMRLVVVMYAEDRDLIFSDSAQASDYSVTRLFDRLQSDAERDPDTMDQRFDAWFQLISVFRLVYAGGEQSEFKFPPRNGYLFDPDRYPFLEGRELSVAGSRLPESTSPSTGNRPRTATAIPRISDGVIYRVLRNLLIVDGERLRYRRLDVEQIGSIYESVIGFNLEVAKGLSIAIKPTKPQGAPATINLESLLKTPGKDRTKWLKKQADQTLGTADAALVKDAASLEELVTTLDRKIAKTATPRVVPAGAIVLQPSDERQRSGSHYTPRSLTEPIVRTTLQPVLEQTPHPAQILALKVCDPAMGSGAFLVEVCRQLGDQLLKAWHAYDLVPTDIAPDEDPLLHARRLVAQRCLYGVDKNPMAVDLAKLSLWLITMAKDQPFTFLDHSLRHGDSLVGLTRQQIIGFHWDPTRRARSGEDLIQQRLEWATTARANILNAREDAPYPDQQQQLALADRALNVVRLTGDACVSAFFARPATKQREERRDELLGYVADWYASGHEADKLAPIAAAVAELRGGEHSTPPFHWEIEFPEAFSRTNGGFDAFVGNPPFLGGRKIRAANGDAFCDWLEGTFGVSLNADLATSFFRRCHDHVRQGGTFGLIATNTISQGDSRRSGLKWIVEHGASIYAAQRRARWPGVASVVVSVVHIRKGESAAAHLDGIRVPRITSYLFSSGGNDDPKLLKANADIAFQGVVLAGSGFLFADGNAEASSLSHMNQLIAGNHRNAERIDPYIGGREINSYPRITTDRFVINFKDLTEEACRDQWPDLMRVLEEKVLPRRKTVNRFAHQKYWWHFGDKRPALFKRLATLKRVLVTVRVSTHLVFCFADASHVFSDATNVFVRDEDWFFANLQSRVHEVWARFLCSSLGDALRYSPTDCFDNFPLVAGDRRSVAKVGVLYERYRARVMASNDEGPTDTYNRFHDPDEQSEKIQKLRALHEAMDRAVLEAYGWHDLAQTARCAFQLDYEEKDENDGGRKFNKKRPWRLRWPDAFRDEVLARLLELNESRHQEELLM